MYFRKPFWRVLLLLGVFVASAAQALYRITPGDMLAVAVFGEPDLSIAKARVTANGTVSYPLLGEIRVQGLTAPEIEKKLVGLLRNGYLQKPQVSVTVLSYRPVYVRGAVARTGAFGYKEGMTVEMAITEAGGFEGEPERITIVREGQPEDEAVVAELNTEVVPGDIILVGAGTTGAAGFFYVYGEVDRPGSYSYREGLTVEKAIILAGGFGARASKRKIKIKREAEGAPQLLRRVPLDAKIERGDIITIGASFF